MSSPTIELLDWSQGEQALRHIRTQVFIIEQGVSPAEEWDDLEQDAWHFLAKVDGVPAACARLLPTGKLTRMAVMPVFRRRGFGQAILERALEKGQQLGWSQIYLDAQLQALNFYAKAGFVVEGDTFMDAGIPHRRMRLSLSQGSKN